MAVLVGRAKVIKAGEGRETARRLGRKQPAQQNRHATQASAVPFGQPAKELFLEQAFPRN